jgi:hypothetical protein
MPKVQRLGWAFTVALLGGVAVLVSLLANQSQVRITQSEKRLRSAMADVLAKKLFAGSPGPFYFLVKRSPNYTWYSSDALSQVYAETWFPQYDVSFRFIPDRPIDSPYAQMWPIRFGSDGQGLGNAKLWGVTVPYAQVSMLQATAEKISTITALRSQDIAGLWAIWDRKDDDILDLPIAGGSPCPLDWSADHPAMMSGWRGAERDAIGAFRWTVTRRADIRLPLGCAGAARISVTVAFAASEANLLGLRLSVNGSPISLVRTASKEGQKFSGVIPPGVLKPSKSDLIRLSIPKLVTIGGQGLGVAVRNLQISPLGAEQ